MAENVLKDLLTMKLRLAGKLIERLPENVREDVKKTGAAVLKAINEAADECLKENKSDDSGNNLKKISVD